MKIIIFIILLLNCAISFAMPRHSSAKGATKSSYSTVHVRSHVTKKGTYIAPSYRTSPNRTKVDNWSSKPNVNPYTGKAGTKNPSTPGH